MEAITCFTVFPAMDLRHGQVVRLQQGDPGRMTVFSSDAPAMASHWVALGARWLHLVNLDGAFGEASAEQAWLVAQLCQVIHQGGARLQLGGGLRSWEDIQQAFDLGVDRVILGTAAIERPDLVQQAVERFGPARVAAALDIRQGRVYRRGWQQAGPGSVQEALRRVHDLGVGMVIVTDIDRDGLSRGLNIPLAREIQEHTSLPLVLAGGLRSLEEVRAARQAGLAGVILGRALYEGQVDLRLALQEEQPC